MTVCSPSLNSYTVLAPLIALNTVMEGGRLFTRDLSSSN